MMRRWTRELRRWLRECFPQPAPAAIGRAIWTAPRRFTWIGIAAWNRLAPFDLAWRWQATAYQPRHRPQKLTVMPRDFLPCMQFGSYHQATDEGPSTGQMAIAAAHFRETGQPYAEAQHPALERTAEPRHVALAIADPDDAIFDSELAWHEAMKLHQRGDEVAITVYLEAGWLADAWWTRRAAA